MKYRFTHNVFFTLTICLLLVAIALNATPALAGELTAREIMEKADARHDGDNMIANMKTNKGKQTIHRSVFKWDNIKFNQDLDEKLFTVRRLEKGI